MDRREIFEKYVQEGSEHSSKILPYSNDDPELYSLAFGFGPDMLMSAKRFFRYASISRSGSGD